MSAIKAGLLVGLGVLALVQAARADDQPFLTLYTTDIETQYEKEIEQSFYWAHQKPRQAFNSYLSRTEFEYGVTDDFQVETTFNYEWDKKQPYPVTGPADTWHAASVSVEAIYRFLNPYFDPAGLAVYFEPTYGDNIRALEAKMLLQKNFFNDTLRMIVNLNAEDTWAREDQVWNKSSTIEFLMGAAYNITPDFSVGVEFNNENDFDGLFGSSHPGSNVYYFGPTISYVGLPFTVVLGAQFQLPWASDHTHAPDALSDGFLIDAERTRVGFRINADIP